MRLEKNLIGSTIILRTAVPEDAEFALQLRLDSHLNKYLKPVDSSIQKQKKWIENKIYEKNDYHMIIEDFEKNKLGLIALYSIDYLNKTFDWGRWIISPDAPKTAAFESVQILYDYAFNKLGLEKAICEVRKGNSSVIKFHKLYGVNFFKSDDKYEYFYFSIEDYTKSKIIKIKHNNYK